MAPFRLPKQDSQIQLNKSFPHGVDKTNTLMERDRVTVYNLGRPSSTLQGATTMNSKLQQESEQTLLNCGVHLQIGAVKSVNERGG